MAGRGAAPKNNPLGHRSKAELHRDELPAEAPRVRPELGDSYQCEITTLDGGKVSKIPGTSTFLPETRDWWDDWCASAQAETFTVTTWRRLRMIAPLVDQFHRTGAVALMAEIRQNEAKLGATPEDMQRLHWKPAEKPAAPKAEKPARRLKVVGE